MKPIRIGRVRIDAEKRMAAFFVRARAGWPDPTYRQRSTVRPSAPRHSTRGAPLYCIASIALNRNSLSAAGYLDRIAPSALVIDRIRTGVVVRVRTRKLFQANCLRAAWRRMRHHRFANPSPRRALPKVSTQPIPACSPAMGEVRRKRTSASGPIAAVRDTRRGSAQLDGKTTFAGRARWRFSV
jgi:hypothetical protein